MYAKKIHHELLKTFLLLRFYGACCRLERERSGSTKKINKLNFHSEWKRDV